MPKNYKEKVEKVKSAAKGYYHSEEDAFEGVREVGRAVKGAAKAVGKKIGEHMPNFSPTQPVTNKVYRVEGPFPGADMTPSTRMNSPKKYKKG